MECENQTEAQSNTIPFESRKSTELDEFEAARQHFLDQSYDMHSFSKINHSHEVIAALAENRKFVGDYRDHVGDYFRFFPHMQNELLIDGHWQSTTWRYSNSSNIINDNNNNNNSDEKKNNNNSNSKTKSSYDKYDVNDNTTSNNTKDRNNGNRKLFPVTTCGSEEKYADQTKSDGRLYPTPSTPAPTPPTTSSDRPFVCSICGKCFRLSSTLCRHKIIHTSQRPHKCTVCSKSFNRSSTLKTHMRTHSKTKEFCCSVCNKGFHQKGNLRNHVLIHTGEKPYACTYCPKAFNKLSNLKFHMHTHTDQQPYRCRFCKVSMARRGELKQHILDHHPVERLKEMQALGN